MKRPSFQFYPEDWLSNSNLRRCSHEEKGIWIDVICLLHDQEEYGIVRWPLVEISRAVGCSITKLRGLVTKGVLKGSDANGDAEALTYTPRSGRKDGPTVTLIEQQKGPLWYSSRMVIDEHKKLVRGDQNTSPKHAPIPPFGDDFGVTPNTAPFTCAPTQAQRAAPPSPSPTPVNPKTIESGVNSACVTSAGLVCSRLKSECGISGVNPMHPKFLALLDAGITADEFVSAGLDSKGKGFAYLLAVAEGRRRDAAAAANLPNAPAGSGKKMTQHQRNQAGIAASLFSGSAPKPLTIDVIGEVVQ